MFNKILVALDGSDHAQRALQAAAQLAKKCEAQLILCHVVQIKFYRSDYDMRVAQAAKDVFKQIGEEQAEAILSEAEKLIKEAGVTDSLRLVGEGDPARAILKASQESGASMIVVGTRGLTGLRELAMGSVAHKLTVASTCPVLVIK